jgi:hypothetical protein
LLLVLGAALATARRRSRRTGEARGPTPRAPRA